MEVAGAVVLVTGANRGLGAAFCRALLQRGAAKVYAGARDVSRVDTPGVIPVHLDITSQSDVEAAAEACTDVTLLVNNAGTLSGAKGGPFSTPPSYNCLGFGMGDGVPHGRLNLKNSLKLTANSAEGGLIGGRASVIREGVQKEEFVNEYVELKATFAGDRITGQITVRSYWKDPKRFTSVSGTESDWKANPDVGTFVFEGVRAK